MEPRSLNFLHTLLATPSPSGDEAAAGRLWRQEAEGFADEVRPDVRGNSFAVLNGGAPRVLLAGHIDEIGVMVSYIDDNGFLSFSGIGGWDAQVLVGQRVRLLGKQGVVTGVIGKKPIHLLEAGERKKGVEIRNLWIDLGVKDRQEAEALVRIGTSGIIDSDVVALPNKRLVARGHDDRIGAFTVLETLRLLSHNRPEATTAAVATCQEEITMAGAKTSAFSFDPQVAIAVDVTFTTDHPNSDKTQNGDVQLGGGPVLSRGSANSPVLFDMLVKIAEAENIPYAVQIAPRRTGTDADQLHSSRGGVAAAVVSIPCRYLHSPNEMIDLNDVENSVKLIAAFVRSLSASTDLIPR
ncbi:endoglucanase [candidate division KSB3 bacterium]|uniref:Endoglucanase n=1 Tax=candidate division KSB3 bacterium TaxID=2044937 RepID=A0A2G6E951_9BACT|nr:MAG: endoglucanase [candidate division KSB3 bacterium]PIE29523.1 MAG: endoglucanase [candidate division KSB3 bacterium]